MDPLNEGKTTMSSNLISQEISSMERVSEQNAVLPVSQPPLPVSWGLQHWSSSERNLVQPGTHFSITTNPGRMPVHQSFDQSPTGKGQRAGSLPLGVQSSMAVGHSSQPTALANKRLQQKASPKVQNVTSIEPANKNKRPAPMEQPQKVRTESFESVRSKMKESLAGALAVVDDKQMKSQGSEKGNQKVTSSTSEVEIVKSESSRSLVADGSANDTSFEGKLVSNETSVKHDIVERSNSNKSLEQIPSETTAHGIQEPQAAQVALHVGVPNDNSFLKDELLQGHGLCWISDPASNSSNVEGLNSHEKKRLKLTEGEVSASNKEATITDAINLASKIEAQLFRLFGGVNKKYKEKGRSLLFNLKDRNNPELRERVLAGKISPERLCTMSVEELASKELSEWRLAKAEELAQMVVRPDMEVDVRRLVRKTHKGEIQVEFEETDSVVTEVELDTTARAQIQTNSNDDNEVKASSEVLPTKGVHSFEQNLSENMDALLQEKSDLMQELIVDEIKDPELLPPVVSLDEFMEALDSEPPFENLPVDSVEELNNTGTESACNLKTGKDALLVSSESKLNSELSGSKEKLDTPKDSKSKLKSLHVATANFDLPDKPMSDAPDGNLSKLSSLHSTQSKSYASYLNTESQSPDDSSTSDKIWEGLVQLNISSLATVTVVYKSGEKTSTREWSTFLEIKGRVKLDAFEKFLQELPLSRSRALMITQLFWKEGSPETGRVYLHEVYDSYISDGRVGFAEPAAGVELYLAPLHPKMTEMLGKYLSKENTEALVPTADAFAGLIVWRRPLLTSSPRLSSNHKHGSLKKQSSFRKQQTVGLHSASSDTSSPTAPRSVMPSILGPPPITAKHQIEDETDDVPPGFGPRDDDLPEFHFVHGSSVSKPLAGVSLPNVSTSACPVEQIREMIHKYGQSEIVKKSLTDDDDDIPEWQPNQHQSQTPLPLPPPPPPLSTQLYQHQQNPLHFQMNPDFVPLPPMQIMPHPYPQNQQFLPLLPPAPMSMQMPLHPQFGVPQGGQSNLPIGWPANPGVPLSGPLVSVNAPYNNMQAPNLVGQNLGSQFYGSQNAMYSGAWRSNNSRNGGA